tara:strand:- start:100 stop:495 length:396 start_codon:yes stop_codon:yes gene_type:complete
MNTPTNKQAGFTLIEMMIVVAIIGILTSMIAPNLFKQLTKAERVQAQSDLKTISTQSKFYYLDNYRLPTSVKKLVPRYFNTIPTDPWGRPYEISKNKKGYVVLSLGRDGRKGSKDDIRHVINLKGYRSVGR